MFNLYVCLGNLLGFDDDAPWVSICMLWVDVDRHNHVVTGETPPSTRFF